MESEATERPHHSDVHEGPREVPATENSAPKASVSGISGWAKNLKIPQAFGGSPNESPPSENSGRSLSFTRLTSGFGLRLSPKGSQQEEKSEATSSTTVTSPQSGGFIGTITKGIVDSSKNAVKAVQVKARHVVSQNKRRFQEGGFDLDMTYITENIIAMGFPAGDLSSGFFGYVEGYYRNHMEEVIKYFDTYHKDKYKVYNLCSERLYDVSLFDGKVASLPFDDHNCPPIQLITYFCQSAYSWLKEDIDNVVVVHCKAGMARTGLMISSLLLFLKFYPTAEESIDFYNQKRCFDGKGLVLPSQIRYVKYFERVLTYFNGENQPGRRCMLRGFRLHRCPYWIRPSITVSDHNGVLFSTKKHPRTKDLSPEAFWFSAPKKGIMVFALPGESGLTELAGDFKIHFHDRQGDFYCWLNTTMMENRTVLNTGDLDGFDKRKLPSPGFQVEVVLVDFDSAAVPSSPTETASENTAENSMAETASQSSPTSEEAGKAEDSEKNHESNDKDDVFSDSEMDGSKAKGRKVGETSETAKSMDVKIGGSDHDSSVDQSKHLANATERLSLGEGANLVQQSDQRKDAAKGPSPDLGASKTTAGNISEFSAMAADASVFTFGDEDDYESD